MVKATKLEVYGNQVKIHYEDGSSDLASPTGSSLWLVTAPNESGGGGGGGIDDPFSWPYPLQYVTSEFGPRGNGFHEGMDFSGGPASNGSPIGVVGNGTVETVAFSAGGFGNYCIVYHGVINGYDRYTLYGHMIAPPVVSVGDNLIKGDHIGNVGNTGGSYGAHLHFETHRVPIGGSIKWENNNPNYSSTRTPMDPRGFMKAFGDGGAIYQ